MQDPDGSGFTGAGVVSCEVLGWVPEVDGDEYGELEEEDPLEGGGCGACGAGSAGAGAASSRTDVVRPRNCSWSTEVKLKWNSGTVSGPETCRCCQFQTLSTSSVLKV